MRLFVPLVVLLTATTTAASPLKVIRYLDGALVEREEAAVAGRVDVKLPRGMKAGSLRVRPVGDTVISRVEISAVSPDRKVARETAQLAGRRDTLTDRLKTLDFKEEIYRASAKAQSGKSPRVTKGNREPLDAVRKGTDFALSRLEEVFRERRKAESELKALESRLAALANGDGGGGRVARVVLAGRSGRVAVSWIVTDLTWTPAYEFRLNGIGGVEITMRADLSDVAPGDVTSVVPSLVAEGTGMTPVAVKPPGTGAVALFSMPVDRENFAASPLSTLSFLFTNRAGVRLPPGEAACYRTGEFVGTTGFAGSLPGEARLVECGKSADPAR